MHFTRTNYETYCFHFEEEKKIAGGGSKKKEFFLGGVEKKSKKSDFSIKVVAISDNSNFSIFQKKNRHFSSHFTLISAHTNFHDPRTSPSGRKVIRRRGGRGRREEEKNKFSGHYVCHEAHLHHRMDSARTSLGPIFTTLGQPLLGEK